VQSRTNWVNQANKHWWVKDNENPYTEVKPFDWIRGYHTGGRSIMWGKQTYRLSDLDLEANGKDGFGVDWPIRYKDLAPWYDYVETFIGVSGRSEGLAQLPDGKFLPPMDLNCVEEFFKEKMAEKFKRVITIGRVAHLTAALPHDPSRGICQSRNMCDRGCPYGAYFSSNASTLPAAAKTGNMIFRPYSIVHSIIYDDKKGKAVGVRVLDPNQDRRSNILQRSFSLTRRRSEAHRSCSTLFHQDSRTDWVMAAINLVVTSWIISIARVPTQKWRGSKISITSAVVPMEYIFRVSVT
jgi:choline dehydrogenase-like flavoprotein